MLFGALCGCSIRNSSNPNEGTVNMMFALYFLFFEYVGPKFMLCLVRETSCSCSVLHEGSLGQVEGLAVSVLQCF
jgi:hypothetical protein